MRTILFAWSRVTCGYRKGSDEVYDTCFLAPGHKNVTVKFHLWGFREPVVFRAMLHMHAVHMQRNMQLEKDQQMVFAH